MKKLIYLLALTSASLFGQSDSLIAHYPFNGNCHNIKTVPNGIPHGIPNPDGISYVGGINNNPNSAIKISATDSGSVDLSNHPILKFNGNSQYTISLWVKMGVVNSYNAILMKASNAESSDTWDYGISTKEGIPYCGKHGHDISATTNISNGNWNHLVATYNNGQHKLYVNNTLEVEENNVLINVSEGNLILGQKGDFGYYNYDGDVDELKIFSKALNQEDVTALFDEKNTGGHVGCTANVNLGADKTICFGDSVILDAGSGWSSVLWSNGVYNQTTTVKQSGTYIVTVMNDDYCEGKDTITVTVNSLPNIDLGPDTTTCSGEPVLLNAGQGWSSILWSDGITTQTNLVSLTGIYTATVTAANGCIASDAINVSIHSPANVDLGADKTICFGDSVILDAGSGWSSVLWSNGVYNQTTTVKQSGTYIVTVMNDDYCEGKDTITVTVNSNPNIYLGPDTTTCSGEPVLLNAGQGWSSILWSDSITTQTNLVSVTGTYTATVTDANGCLASDAINVSIHSPANVDLGADTSICEGDSLLLDAGSEWYNTPNWSNGVYNQTNTVKQSGTYIVTVMNDDYCEGKDTITVAVNSLPSIDLGNDTSICSGESISLDAGTGFIYNWTPGLETDQTIDVTTAANYGVTITDGNGCENSDAINVTVNSLPNVDLGNDTSICDGESISLDAGTGFIYNWTPGLETDQTIDVTAAANYGVTITDGNGCENSDNVNVEINSLPGIDLGNDTSICDGESISLNAGAGFIYNWTPGLETDQTIDVTTDGNYSVTITDGNGCENSDTVFIITGFPNPTPDIQDQTACLGEEIVLEDLNDIGETATYTWTGGTGSGPSDSSEFLPLSTATYRLDVVDINGCTGFDEAVITFLDIPEVSITDSIVMCDGQSELLEAYVQDTSNTLSWNTGQGDVTSITVSQNQLHIVTASNGYCETKDTTAVVVIPLPDISFTANVDDNDSHKYEFIAQSNGSNYTYEWDFGDGNQSVEENPSHKFSEASIYEVCLTADGICGTQVCDSVEVLDAENCVAAFDYEVDGTQVNFTNQSQGNKLSIQYTFEDGTSSYDADPIKDFNQSGTYSVCINIFDSLTNCVSDSCVSITVLQDSSDAFCQADFEYTSLGSKKFSFHNTSIGAISAVTWEFNNGENIIRTADSIEFEFPNAGNFEVCLSIFDAASGCTNSICKTIEVVDTNSVNCRADFDFFIQNTGEVFFNSKAKGTYSHVYFSLGDGISKDSLAFSHTYQNSGHYDVCMSVYDEVSGCQDQYCELVVVNLDTSSVLCEARMDGFLDSENIVHTINQSIGDYTHSHWDFGDGSQSFEDSSATHEFAESGYYTICLNIHDSVSGCQSSICEEVNIKLDSLDVTCLADFEFIAIDEEVTVTNTSLGDNSHSHWSFGDGSYDDGSTASHSYNETGIYEVCLSTWDSVSGCQASVCKQVSIVKDTNEVFCEADFDYIPLSNGEIQFKDASIGNYTHVHWNLGNGIFSDAINPIGNYPNNGVYPVTIMIWDSISKCQASYTEEIAIAVNEDLVECHAKFEYFPINDSLVKFKSISLGNYSDINWDFGDGTFAEGESEVEHVFPHGGFFNVCVGIYDTQTGCHDFSCENVELLKDTTIVDCHANFEFFPTSDSEISFSNLSEGTFTQSFWKFTTGALSYDENPTIDFISGGLYGVCLTVFDEVSGCQDEYCVEVPIIHDTTIYCDAHFEYYVDYRTVKFEPEIKGNITGWTWDYNDGFNSNDSFPSYTYENDGVYEVCLTVFDSLSGCFNTYCDQVSVIGDIDEVDDYIQSDFSYFLDPIDGKVHFKDESVGNPSIWYWDFGDGDSAGVTQNPTYEYAEDGYYEVCLTARNNNGGQETKCQVIAVGDVSTACFAKFDYYANAVTATAHFDNKSLGNITGYNWDFGDSVTSFQFKPSHTYADIGFYPVCLTVSNDSGCEQTFCKEIRVGNSLDNKCLIGCVWPGDANLDIEVNHYDILPIGLHFGETGPSREEVGSDWKGYESQDWSSLLWGDVNNKHGDANGDGIINMDDIKVIRKNFSSSTYWQPRSNAENQLTIDWDADDIDVGETPVIDVGETATLTVSIPDSLDITMYGIGFEIDLDPNVYDYESIEYNFNNSFLGDTTTNLITFGWKDEDEGKIYIAETRNDHEEITGNGVLVEINVTAKAQSTSAGAVLTTEGGVTVEGDTLEFNGDEDEASVIGIEERDGYLVKDLVIFPNPTTGVISYNLPIGTSTDYLIEVFDNIGALVQSTNQLGGGKIEQNFEQFESGIYTIQVTNNKVKYLQKVIVSK